MIDTLVELDHKHRESIQWGVILPRNSVEAMTSYIENNYVCKEGRNGPFSDTGERYVEISEVAICRDDPADLEVVKCFVLEKFSLKLGAQLSYRDGERRPTVYWLHKPEEVYGRWKEDTPLEWTRYALYCTLVASSSPTLITGASP